MSSFMKKTGGLAFKPKVGRRPGATSASASASQSTTRAPTAELSHTPSATPTPTAAVPRSTPTPTPITAAAEPPSSKQLSSPEVEDQASARPTVQPSGSVDSAVTAPEQANQTSIQTAASSRHLDTGAELNTRIQDPTTAAITEDAQSVGSAAFAPATPDATPRRPLPRSSSISQSLVPTVTQEAPTSATISSGLPTSTVTSRVQRPSVLNAAPTPSPLPDSETAPLPTPLSQPQVNGSQENGMIEAGLIIATAPAKKRQYRRRKQPTDEANGLQGDGAPAPKPARSRKRKAPPAAAAAEGQEGATAAVVDAADAEPKRFHRRRITPEPEDIPEDGRPDHATTKIGDLTRDLGIGKKFKHADLILERQRQARQEAKQRRLERQQRAMGLLHPEENAQDGSRAGTPAGEDDNNAVLGFQSNRGQGIDFDIIDGQIMINQNSLVINQHAVEADVQLETVEEDEFTHLTTSASYMRPSKALGPNHWDDEDTEKFYKYLKMFGTDFETISHMFPGRNRRQVKLKFNREEKQRPNRVNAAIMAKGEKRVTIDIEEYKSNRSGFNDPWITPDKFQAEQEQLRQEQEKELEAKRQERRDLGLLEDGKGDSKKAGGGDNKENNDEEEEELLIDDQDVGGASAPLAA